MQEKDPQKPETEDKLPKAAKPADEVSLTRIEMGVDSPIQDFLCRSEHQQLFETLFPP